MHKLTENAKRELQEIEKKGLTQNNIDNAYKLVKIVEGVGKINAMEENERSRDGMYSRDGGYSNDGYSNDGYSRDGSSYDRDSSYRRGRSQRTGRYVSRDGYSRLSGDDTDMDRYREMKKQYSNARDGESKDKMLDALEDFMCGVQAMLRQIYKDSDTGEERNIIRKYCREIAEM